MKRCTNTNNPSVTASGRNGNSTDEKIDHGDSDLPNGFVKFR